MPAIPSFINYKPAWKAKAAIKSSLSRFNRSEAPSSSTPPDAPPTTSSPAVSTVIDIKDDSSMDFDGGQPNEFEKDVVDKASQPDSSNVSSASGPEKLEVSLPPELRIDWFAEKFTGVPSNPKKGRPDTNPNVFDRDTRNTLAGKMGDDQGLVQTLEDALALRIDSNVSSFNFVCCSSNLP